MRLLWFPRRDVGWDGLTSTTVPSSACLCAQPHQRGFAARRDAQPPLTFGLKKDAAACCRVCSRLPVVVFPRAGLLGILLDINQNDVHINPSAKVTPQLLELYNS